MMAGCSHHSGNLWADCNPPSNPGHLVDMIGNWAQQPMVNYTSLVVQQVEAVLHPFYPFEQ